MDLTPARNIIQREEVSYSAAVGESVLKRVGAASNHIMTYQYDSKQWDICGPYGPFGAQVGVDTVFVALFDMQIMGISMYNKIAGTSGVTVLDLRKFTASNTPAGGTSIFTTKPGLSYTAGNNAYLCSRLPDAVNLQAPTGAQMPVFATTQINAGEMITLNIETSQGGVPQDCGLLLMMRPR